jgi:23S rRNA (uridine2552-2'-O)-methyltransferase
VPGIDFAKIDFLDPSAPDKLKEMLGGPADVVLSDMAANATGHKKTDQLKIMALVEAGLTWRTLAKSRFNWATSSASAPL